MAINFPDAPAEDDTYTVGGITWVYDGAKWTLSGASFQPLDSDLTAIAALTTTAFGRGLLELANAAAGRTSLGVVIGTDVQAYSAVLAATTASFLTADETKLDGIEALADVTDAANVAAAGAVMAQSTVTKLYGPITQAAYDLLTPASDTLYVVVG